MNDTLVTVSGWVGGDVTLRQAGDTAVATFRMATRSRRWRDGAWHPGPSTWHQVKAWGELGTNAARSVGNGDPVLVHGRLVVEQWDREDGSRATRYVLVASAIGHNLAFGRASFARPARTEPEAGGAQHGSGSEPERGQGLDREEQPRGEGADAA